MYKNGVNFEMNIDRVMIFPPKYLVHFLMINPKTELFRGWKVIEIFINVIEKSLQDTLLG